MPGLTDIDAAKIGQSFGPIDPWIVILDEVGDPHALAIEGTVNGVAQQRGNTRDIIFSCYELVAFASRRCALRAGNIVTTGMPHCRLEKLSAGDVIRCRIDGIGYIENRVLDKA